MVSEGTDPKRSVCEAQVLDVRTALAAAGEHQGHVHEHLAPVVDAGAVPGRRDAGRERITEPQSVGEDAKGVQSDVGHHAGATGFHDHVTRAVTVHFGSALLVRGFCCLDNNSFPYAEGFSADTAGQLTGPRE